MKALLDSSGDSSIIGHIVMIMPTPSYPFVLKALSGKICDIIFVSIII